MAAPAAPADPPAFLSVPGCPPDFTLVAGTGPAAAEFRVHRVFLARFSPFFAAAAAGPYKEAAPARCELPEDSASALRALLALGDKYCVAELPEEADRALVGPVSQLRGFPRRAAEQLAVAAEWRLQKTVAVARIKLRVAKQAHFERAIKLVAPVAPALAAELLVARMGDMKEALGEFYGNLPPCKRSLWSNGKDRKVKVYLDGADGSSDSESDTDHEDGVHAPPPRPELPGSHAPVSGHARTEDDDDDLPPVETISDTDESEPEDGDARAGHGARGIVPGFSTRNAARHLGLASGRLVAEAVRASLPPAARRRLFP
ncbi:hypothetical protein DFJ74DRAFT_722462 [Hyaloraphidium curvatum]|nr:hypothetical protein DFJ74DRAFT_722462 [Hyaloraphidium curvatum]